MQAKLTSDWTVKCHQGSEVIVPAGTVVDIVEAQDRDHLIEAAVGAKIPVADLFAPAPPAEPVAEEEVAEGPSKSPKVVKVTKPVKK